MKLQTVIHNETFFFFEKNKNPPFYIFLTKSKRKGGHISSTFPGRARKPAQRNSVSMELEKTKQSDANFEDLPNNFPTIQRSFLRTHVLIHLPASTATTRKPK